MNDDEEDVDARDAGWSIVATDMSSVIGDGLAYKRQEGLPLRC